VAQIDLIFDVVKNPGNQEIITKEKSASYPLKELAQNSSENQHKALRQLKTLKKEHELSSNSSSSNTISGQESFLTYDLPDKVIDSIKI